LEVHPQFREGPQCLGEIQGRHRGYASLSSDKFIESGLSPAQPLSNRCLRDSFGFKELPEQDLAWMQRIVGLLCHDLSLSARINYLYVECVSEGPSKNYSPLIIDPEAS
jgi:hypothetical protein